MIKTTSNAPAIMPIVLSSLPTREYGTGTVAGAAPPEPPLLALTVGRRTIGVFVRCILDVVAVCTDGVSADIVWSVAERVGEGEDCGLLCGENFFLRRDFAGICDSCDTDLRFTKQDS